MDHEFQSPELETAVTELSRLPGVGRKTALKLALHLLRRNAAEANALGSAIINMRNNVKYCHECHNISPGETCAICASEARDHTTVCVVENINDVMSIERTGEYNGVYHVLGGVISPMDGIGPDMLQIQSLVDRVRQGDVTEVILALGATMEGDTTNFYLYRRLAEFSNLRITQLARGMAVGNDLEYTDEVTLGRSLLQRTLFSESFNS